MAENLADGDHFAGMPEPDELQDALDLRSAEDALAEAEAEFMANGGNLIEHAVDTIKEITEEVEAGDAHLMTRNELVEFIDWWVLLDNDLDANTLIYDAMEKANGETIPLHIRRMVARLFFVEKGYEKA